MTPKIFHEQNCVDPYTVTQIITSVGLDLCSPSRKCPTSAIGGGFISLRMLHRFGPVYGDHVTFPPLGIDSCCPFDRTH